MTRTERLASAFNVDAEKRFEELLARWPEPQAPAAVEAAPASASSASSRSLDESEPA